MKNLTRSEVVAFKDKVSYFGGKLLCLIPRRDVNLDKTIEFLNSHKFKKNYTYAGRFKIGQRQLANALLSDLKE